MKRRKSFLSGCLLLALVSLSWGQTTTYSWADGSELPQDTSIKYSSFTTDDGIVTINTNSGKQFWFHDTQHGMVVYNGNSFDMLVAGNATVTFVTCTYSAVGSVFNITDANGNTLGTIAADNNGGADGFAVNFAYTGPATTLSATLVAGGSVYIHGMSIENAAAVEPSNGKIDVWDFGGEQLDDSIYNNHLNVDTINNWYDSSITVGSAGNVLPSFTSGQLSWVGGHNDRLRTTHTSITRYDENLSGVTDYTGRIYVNSAANTGRYLSLTLGEDDEVTLICLTQSGGRINFQYVADPAEQTDVVDMGVDLVELHFVAKQAGTYHIFDDQGKPSYYRIYRQDATYATLTGSVDESTAPGIPDGYGIVFTNAAGKSWTSVVSNGTYSAQLPEGTTYQLSLSNANGYIISSGTTLAVNDTTTSYNITVNKIELHTVSGSLTGLGADLSKLTGLVYTPDPNAGKTFQPQPVIDTTAGTYSVQLEPNCVYTISAIGVNDYTIPQESLTITSDTSADIAFAAKPKYHVTFDVNGLTADQLSQLTLTFTNLNEDGYVYSFDSVDDVNLRDGVYIIETGGLDAYPLQLGLTSYLQVNGADTTKTLSFTSVSNWPFDDQVISTSTPAYKGLLFTGNVYNEIAKGHLAAKNGGTIQVPVHPGQKVIITYYYSAEFSIDGGDFITTNSGSTSQLEHTTYVYPGTEDGYVTITNGTSTTSYFTHIQVVTMVAYTSKIQVGQDKAYHTLNDALDAIDRMDRDPDQRVTVMIDPGNYEEMLVIDQPDVTLKNAGTDPNIALRHRGVDIDPNAVRITSYYGHGYDYYSMGSDQKWHADVLRVNQENGSLSTENTGAGTTNGSYWNATVVVEAPGFEADDIIFENSFNQYISRKESQDTVVMWDSGSPGDRPVDVNDTSVQDRSLVERAAAIAFTGSADQAILNKCRVVGRQDSFYGSAPARVVVYEGAMMGAVDYIFGAMTAVFYKTDLVMNTSDVSGDAAYLAAAQQSGGRGYLMYDCNIVSTVPGVDTASQYGAKPGYFGRPWQATTSEVVYYDTTISTSEYPGYEGQSLIMPIGWNDSLGGKSEFMVEYGTIETSGVNNQSSRASWATVLTEPVLKDGTAITAYNFTKGSDGWYPIPDLVAADKQ